MSTTYGMQRRHRAGRLRVLGEQAVEPRGAAVTDAGATLAYASEIESGRVPSVHRMRAEMRVGQAGAQAIVKHLGTLAQAAASYV